MKTKLKDDMIAEASGQFSKKDKTIYRYRNGKQQTYRKSDKPVEPTPARLRNRALMAEASRITKQIVEDPELRRPYQCQFNAYDPSAHNGKRFENLRGFIFSNVFADLKRSPIPLK